MRIIGFLLLATVVGASLGSCSISKTIRISASEGTSTIYSEQTETTSPEYWLGTYKAELPSPKKVKNYVIITLREGNMYTYKSSMGSRSKRYHFESEGRYLWSPDGREMIGLMSNNDFSYSYFLVGDNTITPLDKNKEPFKGESAYQLIKMTNNLEGRSWAIYELEGVEISQYATSTNPIYLEFIKGENRVAGSGGCNRISGGYTLEGDKLTFGRMATTMMACPNMEMEAKFFKMLEKVSRYQMVDNTGMELVGKNGEILGKFVVRIKND